jgi:hypothetical protein
VRHPERGERTIERDVSGHGIAQRLATAVAAAGVRFEHQALARVEPPSDRAHDLVLRDAAAV